MPAMVSRGRGRRTINEINMVPFIDVMLVLLIIFMVTAPLITPSVINLPKVGKATKQPDLVVQIVIGEGDALELKIKDKTSKPAAAFLICWFFTDKPAAKLVGNRSKYIPILWCHDG